jgi:hypothetical protein
VVVEREKHVKYVDGKLQKLQYLCIVSWLLAALKYKFFALLKKQLMKFDEMFYTITTLCIPKEL